MTTPSPKKSGHDGTVLVIGEVLWDRFPDRTVLGGAMGNVAFRLAALGQSAALVSSIGNDKDGDALSHALVEAGVDTRLLQRDAVHATGTVEVTVSETGEPSYSIVPEVAYDYIEFTEDLAAAARTCIGIMYGSVAYRSKATRSTVERALEAAPQALKLYDPNLRYGSYSPTLIAEGLTMADVVKINNHELREIADMFGLACETPLQGAASFASKFNVGVVVVTCGAEGICAMTSEGESVHVQGIPTTVVDTVGAGDSVTAALLDGLLRGKSLYETCDRANRLGSMVAATRGAMQQVDMARL